jgi:putative endonuclease
MKAFAYTYVLLLENGDLYIGATDDLERREKQHSRKAGGRTTALVQGKLIYFEACRSIQEARRRERQLKTGFGRGYLRKRLAFELPQ